MGNSRERASGAGGRRAGSRIPAGVILFVLGCVAPGAAAGRGAVVELPPVGVTAVRGAAPVEEAPFQATVYGREEVEHSAALTTDDFLRRTPGFSLFRRSSSLVAHPTTQGISLRGTGPTGASRSLVLVDGIPQNDPFGGWVYWSRIPISSVERIEVVRGGGSTAWGNSAMGGVVNVVSRPLVPGWTVEGLAGNRGTWRTNVSGAEEIGPITAGLDAQYFRTDGYHVVHPRQRGRIDEPAFSRNRSATATAVYSVGPDADLTVRAGGFTEYRGNGTPYTRNDTRSGHFSSRLEFVDRDDIRWEWSLFGAHSVFASTFSAVGPGRTEETPALDQFDVPSTAVGTGIQFWSDLGENHSLTGAADLRWITGETNEDYRFENGRFLNRRRAGGWQSLAGVFLEDVYEPNERWRFSVGGRIDYWRNHSGEIEEVDRETGDVTLFEELPERDGTVISPRAGVVHSAADWVSLRGAVFQGFRAPTINELYRPFRVGADQTLANPNLNPEKLTGAEIGADFQFADRWHGSVSGFWNNLSDPIANVTIGADPAGGALRQRQNLDRASIRGVELETGYEILPGWSITAGFLLADSVVRRAPEQSGLEGKRLAQTPTRSATIRSRWLWNERYLAEVQGRYSGPQFEDDLNTRRLAGYWVADLYAARLIRPDSAVFVGVENLFDRLYAVGETGDGLVTVGQPVMVHGGVRWRF